MFTRNIGASLKHTLSGPHSEGEENDLSGEVILSNIFSLLDSPRKGVYVMHH